LGERNPRARLTAEAVRQLRQRYRFGRVTLKQLASEYGVHFDTVSKAISGVTWSHIQ